jgi:hypothetical protein
MSYGYRPRKRINSGRVKKRAIESTSFYLEGHEHLLERPVEMYECIVKPNGERVPNPKYDPAFKAPAAKAARVIGTPRRVQTSAPAQAPKAIVNPQSVKPRPKLPTVDAFASAIGAKRPEDPGVVKFDQATASKLNMFQTCLGVRTKTAPRVIGYLAGKSTYSPDLLDDFRKAGCSEVRKEGRTGRNTLKSVLNDVGHVRGSTIVLKRLGDLAERRSLHDAVKAIEAAGVFIHAIDDRIDTRTSEGRGRLANVILAARSFAGSL